QRRARVRDGCVENLKAQFRALEHEHGVRFHGLPQEVVSLKAGVRRREIPLAAYHCNQLAVNEGISAEKLWILARRGGRESREKQNRDDHRREHQSVWRS